MYNAMAWRCSSGQGKPRHPALKELTGSSPDLLAHVLCVWNDHSPPPSPTCCMFKPPHSLGSVLYVFSVLKLVLRTSGQKSSLLMLTSPLLCFFFFFFFFLHYRHLRTFFSLSQYRLQKVRGCDLHKKICLLHSISHNDVNTLKYAINVC